MIELRLHRRLYDAIKLDLLRPHSFAAERVGFVMGRFIGSADKGLVLLTNFNPVPDDHYVEDPTVGARIGGEALLAASHAVYHGRSRQEGVFHIHIHEHFGSTGMSRTDSLGLPPLIPGFKSIGPDAPHGIIILSSDHGTGWVWLPGDEKRRQFDRVSVIGSPTEVFEERQK